MNTADKTPSELRAMAEALEWSLHDDCTLEAVEFRAAELRALAAAAPAPEPVAWTMRDLCRLYAYAYRAGHEDTCEATYTHVIESDVETYHEDSVAEYLSDHSKNATAPPFDERVAAAPEPVANGWWCSDCLRIVPGKEVTFDEYHETCGYPVYSERPQAERVALLEGLLREAISTTPCDADDLEERIRAALNGG